MVDESGLAVVASYQTKFGNWDQRASVRNKPRRVLDETGQNLLFFPPEQLPAVGHPLVGPGRSFELLARSLFQYLHFTTVLEQSTVLPVTARISLGRCGLALPRAMLSDAFKITTDEAYHAQFSYEFINDASRVSGVPADSLVEPAFVQRLEILRDEFPVEHRRLADLIFTVVSETLVSGLLSKIPHDQRLPGPVRALVADHAGDEGRHHSYFSAYLKHLWAALSPAERRMVGVRVPDFVDAFLAPDIAAVRSDLRATGLSAAQAETVLDESYHAAETVARTAEAAQSTVRTFGEVDALDDQAVFEAFARRHFVS